MSDLMPNNIEQSNSSSENSGSSSTALMPEIGNWWVYDPVSGKIYRDVGNKQVLINNANSKGERHGDLLEFYESREDLARAFNEKMNKQIKQDRIDAMNEEHPVAKGFMDVFMPVTAKTTEKAWGDGEDPNFWKTRDAAATDAALTFWSPIPKIKLAHDAYKSRNSFKVIGRNAGNNAIASIVSEEEQKKIDPDYEINGTRIGLNTGLGAVLTPFNTKFHTVNDAEKISSRMNVPKVGTAFEAVVEKWGLPIAEKLFNVNQSENKDNKK